MHELPTSHCYLTYDEVINKAYHIQPHFAQDLPRFTTYDPWFTPEVNDQLLSDTMRGMKEFAESELMGKDILRLKDLLDLQLADARHGYEKLKYYVDMAFNDASATNQIFGYMGFTKARTSVKKMIDLLHQALSAISQGENKSKLIEAYMPPELPAELNYIAGALATDYAQLKTLKKQHLTMTRERIDLFNSLWDLLVRICDDARIIFAHDSARLTIYELYDTEDSYPDMVEVEKIN